MIVFGGSNFLGEKTGACHAHCKRYLRKMFALKCNRNRSDTTINNYFKKA